MQLGRMPTFLCKGGICLLFHISIAIHQALPENAEFSEFAPLELEICSEKKFVPLFFLLAYALFRRDLVCREAQNFFPNK